MIFSRLRFLVRPRKELTPVIGSHVSVSCVAESDLNPTVTWLKDGKPPLPVDSSMLQNNTLVIPSVKNTHAGSNTCRASNALTTIESSVEIKTPLIPSCSVIRKYISSSSGNYIIDPDGEGGLAPFTVYCDMRDKNGVGVTVISHDSESRTLVVNTRGVFTTQEQACLSWPNLLTSLHTVNSSSNMNAITLCFSTTPMAGGYHVIRLR